MFRLQVEPDFEENKVKVRIGYARSEDGDFLRLSDARSRSVRVALEARLIRTYDGVGAAHFVRYLEGESFCHLSAGLKVTCRTETARQPGSALPPRLWPAYSGPPV